MLSQNNGTVPWGLRFCRWLWKHPLPFLGLTILINVVINIGSTWLITPAKTTAIPDTSIIGIIAGWVSTHWLVSVLVGTISGILLLFTWLGSRWSESLPSPHHQPSLSERDREYMLRRLRLRYEQMLAQSLQGAVQVELGLASKSAAVQQAASLALRLPGLAV